MNIVVAIDFSEITSAVLATLPNLLRGLPAQQVHVHLLHVTEPDPEFIGWDAGPDVVQAQVADELERTVRSLTHLSESLSSQLDIPVTPLLVQGPTAETVCKQAETLNATMIVVGSHGHGAAYDLVVGSISAAIIKQSSRPVLVIPVKRSD